MSKRRIVPTPVTSSPALQRSFEIAARMQKTLDQLSGPPPESKYAHVTVRRKSSIQPERKHKPNEEEEQGEALDLNQKDYRSELGFSDQNPSEYFKAYLDDALQNPGFLSDLESRARNLGYLDDEEPSNPLPVSAQTVPPRLLDLPPFRLSRIDRLNRPFHAPAAPRLIAAPPAPLPLSASVAARKRKRISHERSIHGRHYKYLDNLKRYIAHYTRLVPHGKHPTLYGFLKGHYNDDDYYSKQTHRFRHYKKKRR